MYQLACFHFCVHPVWQLSPGPVFNLFLVFPLVWFISHLPTFNLPFCPSAPLLVSPFLLFSFLFHRYSFSLVVFTFLLSPSPTLIRRRRYGSALWDWRKEGLIPYLNVCVRVRVWMCASTWAALCMLACTPLCLCEIGRYWSEFIRGFNGAV